jgi:hypothetical protein
MDKVSAQPELQDLLNSRGWLHAAHQQMQDLESQYNPYTDEQYRLISKVLLAALKASDRDGIIWASYPGGLSYMEMVRRIHEVLPCVTIRVGSHIVQSNGGTQLNPVYDVNMRLRYYMESGEVIPAGHCTNHDLRVAIVQALIRMLDHANLLKVIESYSNAAAESNKLMQQLVTTVEAQQKALKEKNGRGQEDINHADAGLDRR